MAKDSEGLVAQLPNGVLSRLLLMMGIALSLLYVGYVNYPGTAGVVALIFGGLFIIPATLGVGGVLFVIAVDLYIVLWGR